MGRLRLAMGSLSVVALVAGAALFLGTCWGGVAVADQAMQRDASGAFRVELAPLALEPGTLVAIDTWADYTGSGELAFAAEARSARGARVSLSESTVDDEGGSTWGSFLRVGTFTPADAGPWTLAVTARPSGGIAIESARAVVREGAIDGELGAIAATTIAIGLALIAGMLPRAR